MSSRPQTRKDLRKRERRITTEYTVDQRDFIMKTAEKRKVPAGEVIREAIVKEMNHALGVERVATANSEIILAIKELERHLSTLAHEVALKAARETIDLLKEEAAARQGR